MSWEDTFQSWAKPPGETEQTKCNNAVKAICCAINASTAFAHQSVTAVPQGSYNNRTNVRADSDVDVGVICCDSFFFDLPEGTTSAQFSISTPAKYPFSVYKGDVENALVSYLKRGAVTRGNKAFDVHENTYRIDADVVPCFEYRRYEQDGSYLTGTSFLTDQGFQIINWPEQNYKNGVAKNDATGRRFKAIIRILKRLRNKMDDDSVGAAKPITSFLIECLVWNVPIEGFGHDTYTADVRWALAHLFNNTREFKDCKEWGEVNELKYLFRAAQPWTMQQAHDFVSAAWDYIGFK
jgi:hypothetical protein